ncbi:TPA: DGQHR domain-containing protein [Escherichia coli]
MSNIYAVPSAISKTIGFDYPCVVGYQGNQRIISVQVSFGALSRFLALDEVGHTLERSQRELNRRRATAFAEYVVNAVKSGSDYIIPPLIGNCDGELTLNLMNESFVGYVTIPMDATIRLFDGQHRQAGIRQIIDTLPDIRHHSVTIMLTENLPIETRQQFFADINGNASKPSAAINIAYDQTNVIGQTVKRVVLNNPVLAKKVDFERNSVSSRNNEKWLSFKSLHDATERFASYPGEGKTTMRTEQDIQMIWDAWVRFTGLDDTRGISYREYSLEWLTFTSVMINAFGFAIKELLGEMTVSELTERLDKMGDKTKMSSRDNYFVYTNWIDSCVSRETGKIIASVKGQRAAAVHLVKAIRSVNYIF